MLIAKYSSGASIEELKGIYSKTLSYLIEGWDDSEVKVTKGNPPKIYDDYWGNHYCYMTWMLSMAILLNISKDEVFILQEKIEKGNIMDELILFLLQHLTDKNYAEHKPVIVRPFKIFNKADSLQNVDSKLMKSYLNRWYKNTKQLTWHSYSSSIERGQHYYYGYWSFEAAAIVVIMDLDDSSFRDNQYYPKDLVDYYRSLSN